MKQIGYSVIRSRRKTISISVSHDGKVTVRVPVRMTDRDIRRFIDEKQNWIEKQLFRAGEIQAEKSARGEITEETILQLHKKAKMSIPPRVVFWAGKIGVTYGKITIRHQKTRWGSCSSKGNLNFNCMLMMCPDEVIDYVIIHELCHRREMNHSAGFWAAVENVCPEYRVQRKWLKQHGPGILL